MHRHQSKKINKYSALAVGILFAVSKENDGL